MAPLCEHRFQHTHISISMTRHKGSYIWSYSLKTTSGHDYATCKREPNPRAHNKSGNRLLVAIHVGSNLGTLDVPRWDQVAWYAGPVCPVGPSSSKKCLDLCAIEQLLLTCQAYVSRTTGPRRPSLLPYSAAVAAVRTAVPRRPFIERCMHAADCKRS
jgi:hypothetical protein